MSSSELSTSTQLPLSRKDRFLLSLLQFLSRLPLARLRSIGLFLGTIVAWFPSGPAWVIRRNLKLCFPEKSEQWLNETTQKNLINTAQTALEFTKTWGMPPDTAWRK